MCGSCTPCERAARKGAALRCEERARVVLSAPTMLPPTLTDTDLLPRDSTADAEPTLARARATLRLRGAHLRARRPWIYWTDLLLTGAIGWSGLVTACVGTGATAALGFVLAMLAFHRGISFLHELAHVRYAVPGYDFAWNVLIGLPLLVPSFVYTRVHIDHHAGAIFGTARDPEYTRIAGQGRLRPLLILLGAALSPLVLAVRWLVVAPLSLVHPAARSFVVRRLSSLTGSTTYTRPPPRGGAVPRWALLEGAVSLWAWALALGTGTGMVSAHVAAVAVALAVSVSLLHGLRSFGTHRFSATGEVLPFETQFLDSVNFIGHPLVTELWAPAGLRYHALHHLAPDLPYHALGAAHRLLEAELPADDLYHRATVRRVSDIVREVLRATRRVERATDASGSVATAG